MQIQPNQFICADSMEVLREIQDKTFDLCLTDPPYGINYDPFDKHWSGEKKETKKILGDDKPFDPSSLLSFNNLVLWGANYYSDKLPVGDCIVWDKCIPEKMFIQPIEIGWARSANPKTHIVRIHHGGVVNADSLNGNNEPRYHPTQKPVALFVWCLLNYSKSGDFVIDPFCGSGTTALACHKTGRKFLCIDKDAEYIKIAQQRYADLIAQQDLFKTEDGAQENAEGRGTACNSASPKAAQVTMELDL